ncbi:unnamed protein product [Ciceribacter selenitireducens ATCC BAA-1503]|uniref:Uncharacterized protein n=1 Tax=Ciceribacter selenitireducens ATCC BAA-1503 TaxID=1336235 RepID=A0A376ABH6_9HYPH|nr:unnamed protein product [Ciceribacter selenitireducens ATCC BAA-1503]
MEPRRSWRLSNIGSSLSFRVPETSVFPALKTRRKAKMHPRAHRAVGC